MDQNSLYVGQEEYVYWHQFFPCLKGCKCLDIEPSLPVPRYLFTLFRFWCCRDKLHAHLEWFNVTIHPYPTYNDLQIASNYVQGKWGKLIHLWGKLLWTQLESCDHLSCQGLSPAETKGKQTNFADKSVIWNHHGTWPKQSFQIIW